MQVLTASLDVDCSIYFGWCSACLNDELVDERDNISLQNEINLRSSFAFIDNSTEAQGELACFITVHVPTDTRHRRSARNRWTNDVDKPLGSLFTNDIQGPCWPSY